MGTVWLTLSATDAVVRLAHLRYGTVQANEVVTTKLVVFIIHFQTGQGAVVLAFIIMYENSRDVDTIDDDELLQRCLKGEDDK